MSNFTHSIDLSHLMQPELLSEDEIRNILAGRCIKAQDLIKMDKEQLLNMYHRLVTPLEQRTDTKRLPRGNQLKRTPIAASDRFSGCEDGVKKLKINISSCSKESVLKRTYSTEVTEAPGCKKAKQKICWP